MRGRAAGGSGLGSASLRSLLSLLDRGIVTGGDAAEAMALLLDATGSDAVGAGQGTRFEPWEAQRGLPDSWIENHDRYRHQDPLVPKLQESLPGTWFFVDRLKPKDKELDLYRTFSQDLGDGALVRLYSPFASDLFLVLYRQRKQAFTAEDEVLLQLLAPRLARGFATRRGLALSAAPSETLAELVRGSAGYATISFPSGVVSWSARARALWRSRLSIGPRGSDQLDRMLLLACARFERGEMRDCSQTLLPGVRLDFAHLPPCEGEVRRVLALVVIVDGSVDAGAREAPAEALLTTRQRAVAKLLVSGASLPEIARRLRIAPETARSYRREIYDRLGVHNRAELVAILR